MKIVVRNGRIVKAELSGVKSKFTLTRETYDLKYGILYDGYAQWHVESNGSTAIVEAETYENAMEALRNCRRQERKGMHVDKIDPWDSGRTRRTS
jgi:hypothetical protein